MNILKVRIRILLTQLLHLCFILILLLIFEGKSSYAQKNNSYLFEHISELDGLGNNNVLFVTQDSKGFIWVGTEGGLNKYDGHRFKHYRHDPKDSLSISDNYVTSLCELSHNKYLVGTMNGLNIFNPEKGTFKPYNLEPTGFDNYNWVTCIVPSKNGGAWIGSRSGLYRYQDSYNTISWLTHENRKEYIFQTDDLELLHYKNENTLGKQLNDDAISSVLEDKKGNVWIATDFGGVANGALHKMEPGQYFDYPEISKKLKFDEEKNENSIGKFPASLFEDKNGNIWLGTWMFGLYRINPETYEITRFHEKTKNAESQMCNNIFTMAEDSHKNMWIATYNKGLYRLDASELNSDSPSFMNFKVNHSRLNSITSNHLRNLYFDEAGVLWISTLGSGINKMTEESTFSFLKADKTNEKSLSNDDITGLYLEDDNFIWLGFHEGSFSKYNIKTEKVNNYKLTDEDSEVRCLIRLNKNEILLGIYKGGLHLFNERSKIIKNVIKDYSAADSLQEKSFECFKRLNDSIILCGMSSMTGLIEFNTNTKKFIQIGNHKFVNDIVLDSNENIWVFSSWEDINVLDRSYKIIKSIPRIKNYNIFHSGAMDIKGNTWLASKFGLRIIDSTFVMKSFDYDESLSHGEINGVIKGTNNCMWVFGISGIAKVDPNKRTVLRLDGTRGLVFKKAVKSPKGEIYFSTNGGLVSFYPDSLALKTVVPKVAITRFDIFNKEINVGDTVYGRQILSTDISYTDHIELTHKSNVLSFEFSCLDYSATHKNQYEYVLEGIDKEWVHQDGNRNFASYAGLPHGEYTFRVRAANSIGVWNEKGVSLTIEILPPWWATLWFKLFIFIIVIVIIWMIVYYKQMNLKRANIRLEKTVAIKTEELLLTNEQLRDLLQSKDRFFSILAHDLRNPFGTIEQLLTILYDDYKDYSEEERKGLLGDLKQLSSNTYIILENLLIWGRRENDQLNESKIKNMNLKEQVGLVINQFKKHPKKIKLLVGEIPKVTVLADYSLLDFILRNLIQNAIKFSAANGKIEIFTKTDKDKVWVMIKDHGVGMNKKQIESLLVDNMIESQSGTMGEKGTGLGIFNCRDFITKMNGEFNVLSEEGKGSTFMFSLPLAK